MQKQSIEGTNINNKGPKNFNKCPLNYTALIEMK